MDAGEIIDEIVVPWYGAKGGKGGTDRTDRTNDFGSPASDLPDGGDVGCDRPAMIPISQSSPLPASSPAGGITQVPKGWDGVAYWSQNAKRFSHASVASQVMAGFELLELRSVKGVRKGAPKGNQNARRENQIPSNLGIDSVSWEELVREYAGVSDETARLWMKMAEACRPRLKRMNGLERLQELLQVPMTEWDKDATELVSRAVHKLADGRTQMEFMLDMGVLKAPQGSGAKGGARPPAQKLDPLAELAEQQAVAREEWIQAMQVLIDYYADKFCVLNDAEVQAQMGALEVALQARRTWLARPVQERSAAEVRSILKR